jgi:hypothetical protein
MSEAHTADLGTRYRYRQEGAANERERINKILDGWHVSLCKCDVCKAVREIKQSIEVDQK